jgi:hypothetical protein
LHVYALWGSGKPILQLALRGNILKIDLDSLTYLEEEVDSEQIERIIEGIKKSWLDTL